MEGVRLVSLHPHGAGASGETHSGSNDRTGDSVRKLVALLLVLGACRSTPTPAPVSPSTGTTGTATSEAAVTAFLGAVKAGDLQAMSLVWGTEKGPASEQMDRAELEKR